MCAGTGCAGEQHFSSLYLLFYNFFTFGAFTEVAWSRRGKLKHKLENLASAREFVNKLKLELLTFRELFLKKLRRQELIDDKV